MSLTRALREKLEFQASDMDKYDLYARLKPLHEAMLRVCAAADRWINGEPGSKSEVDWDELNQALAELTKRLQDDAFEAEG